MVAPALRLCAACRGFMQRAIKAASPTTKTLMYINGLINFRESRLHAMTKADPSLLLKVNSSAAAATDAGAGAAAADATDTAAAAAAVATAAATATTATAAAAAAAAAAGLPTCPSPTHRDTLARRCRTPRASRSTLWERAECTTSASRRCG